MAYGRQAGGSFSGAGRETEAISHRRTGPGSGTPLTTPAATMRGSCGRTAPPISPTPWRWPTWWPTWGWTRTPSWPPCSTTTIEDTDATHEEIGQAVQRDRGRPGGGGHQADPGEVHLHRGRGADGEPAEDAHGHGPGHPGDPHQNLRPAAQHAHHGVPDTRKSSGRRRWRPWRSTPPSPTAWACSG